MIVQNTVHVLGINRYKLSKLYSSFWIILYIGYFDATLHKLEASCNTKTNLDLTNTTPGYAFRFQHKNSRTFPVEDLEHDSGRTLVSAEYGYPKGSPDTNS
jgi:hypothetical protein